MENKLFLRSKNLLTYLSYNKIIDDSTFEDTLKTLDIIKTTNDNDKDYIAVYKSLLWFLLGNNTETIFDDDIFIDKMTDIINKNIYISFYNEYLHDNNPEVIERKKELAKQHKQDIKDKYFDRHKQYPDKEIILKLSDPILKYYMEF
jgi:hypothetical protein